MTPAWTTDTVTADLARAVRYTLLWGLEGVALRTVGGPADRVPFVNEAALRRRLDEADLPVVVVDPGLFEGSASSRAAWLNGVDQLEETAAFCRRVGCGVVRVGALAAGEGGAGARAEALGRAGEVAGRHGLRLAVRNEAGSAVATGAALAGLVRSVGHSAVGADWRPADALQAGEEPAAGLDALLESGVLIASVGVRDGRAEGAGWAEAAVGEGAVGWGRQLAALAAAGYAGPLVLDALPGPARTHGLGAATALVTAARQAQRAAAG